MRREVLVVLGTDGRGRLPGSDRAALGLALSAIEGTVTACARTTEPHALVYAAAAGVGRLLELEALEERAFDVVLVGRGGCGDAGELLPAMLAESRGAALAYEVVDLHETAKGLEVTRDLGRGARDVLLVRGPAVLAVADTARSRTGYISRRRLRAVAMDRQAASVASVRTPDFAWELAVPRVRVQSHASRLEGSATTRRNKLFGITPARGKTAEDSRVITGSAETCARHLLRYLAHQGFLGIEIDEDPDLVPRESKTPGRGRAAAGGERRAPYRVGERGKKP
jgi:electron transfer flavoprotein alpha/beta subunit